jgi:hypothetical protein
MNKRLAGTGLAIGLVAGAGAGLVLELSGSAGASPGVSAVVPATDGSTPDSTDAPATTDSTAPDANAPETPAKPDLAKHLQSILKPLIDDGTITQAQADKVIAAIEAARPALPKGGGRHIFKGPGFGLDVIANALGITADDVRTALKNGQSLADLAVSKGKTAQDVIDAIVKEATTAINERVTAGDLTQADADKILADITKRATDFVNNTPTAGPFFGGPRFGGPWIGGPGMGRGHHGQDGDADDAPSDSTATTVTG